MQLGLLRDKPFFNYTHVADYNVLKERFSFGFSYERHTSTWKIEIFPRFEQTQFFSQRVNVAFTYD